MGSAQVVVESQVAAGRVWTTRRLRKTRARATHRALAAVAESG